VKVADTNHLDVSRCLSQSLRQVCDKPVCVILVEFSPLQYMGKVGNKVRGHKSWKSVTQIMEVGDMICVRNFPAGKFRWKSQSGVMEFGLNKPLENNQRLCKYMSVWCACLSDCLSLSVCLHVLWL